MNPSGEARTEFGATKCSQTVSNSSLEHRSESWEIQNTVGNPIGKRLAFFQTSNFTLQTSLSALGRNITDWSYLLFCEQLPSLRKTDIGVECRYLFCSVSFDIDGLVLHAKTILQIGLIVLNEEGAVSNYKVRDQTGHSALELARLTQGDRA
jgi:hypothetical protein